MSSDTNHFNPDLEDALEQATIALFAELGWAAANAYEEAFSPEAATPGRPYIGREHQGQVVLVPRLRAALESLNPGLPAEAVHLAIEELTRDRSAMSLAAANRDIYQLLKDGVKVAYRARGASSRWRRCGSSTGTNRITTTSSWSPNCG
jgi:type I restriction enzyme R subunit